MQFAIIESGSEGDVFSVTGPFEESDTAKKYLREVLVPKFVFNYELGASWRKANIGFYSNGDAADGASCTYWRIIEMNQPTEG